VAREMNLDTSDYPHLDSVTVTLYTDGQKNVQMSGTRPAKSTDTAGYSVRLFGLSNAQGKYTPSQATARIEEVPASEVISTNDSSGTMNGENSGSGSDGTSSDSNLGTMSHGGNDGEGDYEGGIWVRSEDSPDVDLTYTEGWIDWTTSGGEVDYVDWKYHAVGCDTGCSTWYVEDSGHNYSDFSGDTVEVKFYGDFYNYDFPSDGGRTEAHHRLWTTGNPDGSMDWTTDHWHTGEHAWSLRTDAGWFGNYDQHANHCAQGC
jgi:hypothetical protein